MGGAPAAIITARKGRNMAVTCAVMLANA